MQTGNGMTRLSPTEAFLAQLRLSLAEDTFVGLQLSGAVSTEPGLERMEVRLIHLKGAPHLSFTTHQILSRSGSSTHPTHKRSIPAASRDPFSRQERRVSGSPKRERVVTKNLSVEEGLKRIGNQLAGGCRSVLLRTSRRDWQLHCPTKGRAKLVGHKPGQSSPPSRAHDQPKSTLLGDPAGDWLQALGILDAAGRPKPSMADKHRQINRYTEILHHLARDCGWADAGKPGSGLLRVADVGCGKGYLTFAAWHLFHRRLHRPVSVMGVETRPELVGGANGLARQIQAEGLEFIPGEIASVRLPQLDGLIALHACNTATDDAIRRGIELNARLIVVAPCCHQALRPELGSPELFASLLRHGLFKERLAEWLTDGLRTLFLEWAGYQTKVIEFVASEHTPKNLMIAGVRKHKPFAANATKERILELKRFFGIQHHALDDLLNPGAVGGNG